ncbi:pyridoxamine 5'-phosphate oxidase family protein [Pararcticibacter amylolyticus]|uniref:Pyridoxamine 5'-phosphate oxidase N-terminal domain-containing protein n=1 Tax=Pararcticibacter amylolyticus TaxID=2173175 RepID=A0A2U2PM81_9SPHI|nr:pyridoxamine 5'-phosphate oxidase family protein [Pararcticibacter amylolyticus]PWG82500.1 hypothetical protein DDR33_01135 [Pararcticibacter amylolyticus]
MIETLSPAMEVDKRIVAFLQSQTVLTLATCTDGIPYCATCFYAYSEKYNSLIFKSSPETLHVVQGLENDKVAGSVLPDKLITGKVKGIQFSGSFVRATDPELPDLQKVYYKKYPFAMAIGGELWAVKLTRIKFTDNTLGFGKKLLWEAK